MAFDDSALTDHSATSGAPPTDSAPLSGRTPRVGPARNDSGIEEAPRAARAMESLRVLHGEEAGGTVVEMRGPAAPTLVLPTVSALFRLRVQVARMTASVDKAVRLWITEFGGAPLARGRRGEVTAVLLDVIAKHAAEAAPSDGHPT